MLLGFVNVDDFVPAFDKKAILAGNDALQLFNIIGKASEIQMLNDPITQTLLPQAGSISIPVQYLR